MNVVISTDTALVPPAGPLGRPCAADVAIRPDVLARGATLADLRAALASDHQHLALVVDGSGLLLTTVDEADLHRARDLPAATPAVAVGTLTGRTVAAGLPEPELTALLRRTGTRRLAVVDERGRLLGLACFKRSGRGYCTDADVADRRRSGGAAKAGRPG